MWLGQKETRKRGTWRPVYRYPVLYNLVSISIDSC